jgi:hypothetical protein
MLSSDDFSPVTLQERDLFRNHYEKYQQVHSDNTFTNMICWNHFANYTFAHCGDNIIISSTIDGKTRFRMPIGPRDGDLLGDLFSLAVREGEEEFPLAILDPGNESWIRELYPDIPLHPQHQYFEYVYRASDLALLTGRPYLNIRHQLNRFRRNCSPIVEQINDKNLKEVHEFLVEWCEWKDCVGEPILENEKEAVFYAIDHFTVLGINGLAIRVAGKIGAISLFERLNSDTALVHFEKGLPDCEGIYKAINAETAKSLIDEGYRFINRESDMGVPGLREAKMRYHPDHMVEVYFIAGDDLDRVT